MGVNDLVHQFRPKGVNGSVHWPVNDIVHLEKAMETTVNGSVHCVGRKRLHAFYKTVPIRKTVKWAAQWLAVSWKWAQKKAPCPCRASTMDKSPSKRSGLSRLFYFSLYYIPCHISRKQGTEKEDKTGGALPPFSCAAAQWIGKISVWDEVQHYARQHTR